MKHLFFLLIITNFCFPIYAQIDMYQGHEIEKGSIIIKYAPPSKKYNNNGTQSNLQEIFNTYPPQKVFPALNDGSLSRIVEIYVPDISDFTKTLNALNILHDVEYAEPRYVTRPMHVPFDSKIASQYYLETIKAFDAWDISMSDTSIVVAVTDEGFDLGHSELINKIAYNYNDVINGVDDDNDGYIDNFRGWDLGENDNSPHSSTLTHGTRVAGILSAETNNNEGIAGVGYNVRILPVKLANDYGHFIRSYESVVYAAMMGADIINCSWGGTAKHQFGADVIAYAQQKGCIVVAAAGNSNDMSLYYPASFAGVISVAGTSADDQKWTPENSTTVAGSTYNEFVDICAPATNIFTLSAGNSYTTIAGGSSSACPMVSGALALMKSHFPTYSSMQLVQQLMSSSDVIDTLPFNMPYQGMLGSGRLHCYNALVEKYAGVVIEQIEFYKKTGSDFYSGDTVFVKGRIVNYLENCNNLTVSLVTRSNHLLPVKSVVTVDSVPGGYVGEMQELFSFVINQSAPFNFDQVLLISVKDEDHSKRQYVNFTCNSTAQPFTYANIATWINASGRIGENKRGFYVLDYCGKNILSQAGLIVKNEFDEVVSCIGGKNLFSAMSLPALYQTDSTYSMVLTYKDIIGLNYTVKSRVWVDKYAVFDHLNFEYVIGNSSNAQKINNYAGVYFDWDIAHNYSNFIEHDSVLNLQIVQSSIVGTPVVGLLGSSRSSGFYALDNTLQVDYRNNFAVEDQAAFISLSRLETTVPVAGDDVSTIIWKGPFSIEQQGYDTLSFTLLFAPDVDSVKKIAAMIQGDDFDDPENTAFGIDKNMYDVTIGINKGVLSVSSMLLNGTVYLHSVLGTCGAKAYLHNGMAQMDISHLPFGIYYLLLDYGECTVNKIVLLHR